MFDRSCIPISVALSDTHVKLVQVGAGDWRIFLTDEQRVIRHEIDAHLRRVWPFVMRDWQKGLAAADSTKARIALVTRDCVECGTRVRAGVLISPLSPGRPAGSRAYCAACKKVTVSPVQQVRGLLVEDDAEGERNVDS